MLLHGSQLRGFGAAAGLQACRATLTRAAGRDAIEVCWRGPHSPSQAELAEAFRDHCRLRADRFAPDPALEDGVFELVDQRDMHEAQP